MLKNISVLFKRIFIISMCLVFLHLTTSCKGTQPEPPASEIETPTSADADEPRKFAMITKGKDNPYMLAMFEGFEDACNELGAEAVLMGPDSYTADAQATLIKQAVADGVNVIAIAANHSDALEGLLKEAMQAGICVVSLDSSVNPNSRSVHIQQADPEKVGRVLIQAANKMVGGSGKGVIISSTPYASNQNVWLEWMKKEYMENPEVYKDFILLDDRYGEDALEKTMDETILLLEEHPDLDIIITPSAVSMKAVGMVLQEKESEALFTGLGLPSEISSYIESGSCPWMYLWNPIDLGYLAAYTSQSIISGEITAVNGDSFTAGKLGIRSVSNSTDGGTEVLLGDPMKFDKNNINQWKSVY